QEGLAEISASISHRWNRCNSCIDELGFAELFEIEEEETLLVAVVQLPQPDRAAEVKSVIVLPLSIPDVFSSSARVTCSDSVGEWRTCVQGFVYEVIVDSTMELICA